ncbi:MAG: antibiotic biosynthesis monooxygenase [Agarilytica sp.]
MYAVIFRAKVGEQDSKYFSTAEHMRQFAIDEYGCKEFVAVTEGDDEIAISYWESQDQIKSWRKNAEHIEAQEHGKESWYKSYSVQVVEVIREYSSQS